MIKGVYVSIKICFILWILFIEQFKAEWNLIFDEEFNDNVIDTNKWEIDNEDKCAGNYVEHLNCNTNSIKNLRLLNGTLAITAIHEKHLDKEFTSAKITTNEAFTYGKFEIKAALPKGKLLDSRIFLTPKVGSSDWARSGQVTILSNQQTAYPLAYIHYDYPNVKDEGNPKGPFKATSDLHDFHVYTLEWNEYEFKWFFDGINHFTFKLNRSLGEIYTKNGEPFDKPFKLEMSLGVGGKFFTQKSLTVEEVIAWDCSLFIIDYIRIYSQKLENNAKTDPVSNAITSSQICSSIMPLIKTKKSEPKPKELISHLNLILIVGILLIFAFVIIIYLFVCRKRQNSLQFKRKLINRDNSNAYSDTTYPLKGSMDIELELYDVVQPTDDTYDEFNDINQIIPINDLPGYESMDNIKMKSRIRY